MAGVAGPLPRAGFAASRVSRPARQAVCPATFTGAGPVDARLDGGTIPAREDPRGDME